MSKITNITAYEILDSRGNPTVEAEITVDSGEKGVACAPSGASTGSKEALELRDGDPKRYFGKGVKKAVHHIENEIFHALKGKSVLDQQAIDQSLIQLDGTPNKEALGANAILAVSLATAKVAAAIHQLPLYQYIAQITQTVYSEYVLPVPMINILNGGAHANNNIDIQEFMIQPVHTENFAEALRMGAEIFHCLKKILLKKNMSTTVGDEGGFAPNLASNKEALSLICDAVDQSGYQLGKDVYLALDCAASEFFVNNQYHLKGEDRFFSSKEFADYLFEMTSQYPIISIEDGLDESDWSGWQYLTEILGKKVQLVGDDLFVTNSQLLKKGIEQKIANAILIKFNQIGTLSETLEAIQMAKQNNYASIISHRSGETEDDTIADLAVGTGVGQIKTGSLCRSDRLSKYNQLLRIEKRLHGKSCYSTLKFC